MADSQENRLAQIALLIRQAGEGDHAIEERVINAVQEEILERADRLVHESGAIQAKRLVHEVWLRVSKNDGFQSSRSSILLCACTARAMRRLLVNHVTNNDTSTEGTSVGKALESLIREYETNAQVDLCKFNDSMEKLSAENARQFQVLELQWFGGMTMTQIADALGIEISVAETEWTLARAKLRHMLDDSLKS